ncbi:arylsulfatase [Paraflavitalea sp. CAU 1676]|uniref:arylsulfatase n=1 Tax=Paraflavitalea sp. CAU 1676 TaxID=3032598 RepID=UPI0023DB9108|nr:arylsulfatase [Paraflavitalea sp. CAU 1676]MDF2190393.1 arylsulfatase [Paraflavitalea sp. CAU 1676]
MKRTLRMRSMAVATALTISFLSFGQQPSTPRILPRPDFHFPGNVGRTYLESDPAQFPQMVQAPKGAPNILLILLDDAGFGQFSTFGGGVPSPTMDKLAAEGLRYNRFHTTALCSPTRAALITGRNHHSAAFASITEVATGYEGYTCVLPRSCGTVGEVLRQNGYSTAWIGKNHNTPPWELSAAGPFDRWANGLGFDYFYGFNAGDMNHWNPILFENRDLVPSSKDPAYHLTTDLADHAIAWVRKMKSIAPDKPFFLYVAPGATHAPHQAPKSWIDKFKGQFDDGWDAYREKTFERQKSKGVIPAGTKLTPRPASLPAWSSLNAQQKKLYARMMEVFAAYGAQCDYEMGRIVEAVKQLPDADNTMIIYIAGDNGSSAEGGLEGSLNENLFFNGFPEKWEDNLKAYDEIGGPKHFNHFTSQWAWAMNTPFQWTKQVASHFGGTRNPLIIDWPAKVKDKGGLRSQFVHTIDIVPTIYEVCNITAPDVLNGIEQKPIEGTSFAYSFPRDSAQAKDRREVQYFELGVNRGMYSHGWMASAMSFVPWNPNRDKFDPDQQKWELYHVDEDFSQANDLAASNPEKLRQLQDLWWVEAAKYNVLPLDWRGTIRFNAELMGRPSLIGHRKSMTYYPGTIGLPDAASPPMTNKSWTITAEFEVPASNANGMIVTHGGLEGGYGLYLRDGKPTFVYNYLAAARPTFAGKAALSKGKVTLVVNFAYDGGGLGKGGTITMTANGKEVAKGRLEKTIPIQFSLGEGLDIGQDVGSPVDFTYKMPFAYTGKIDKVTIDLK